MTPSLLLPPPRPVATADTDEPAAAVPGETTVMGDSDRVTVLGLEVLLVLEINEALFFKLPLDMKEDLMVVLYI